MLQTTTNINIDFCEKRHILINAKQLDRDSRFLSVTCYNNGELYSLNNGEHAAYVRYRKADNYGVFNNCDINNRGKIIVKLTEQMLSTEGICYADLIIVNKGEATVNPNTGEINELIANASVLSTMTFCIDVSEVTVANSDIESTYEFTLLNENLEKYWADFEDVMKTSKSWAVGETDVRDGEDTNNSKYWATQSKNDATVSNTKALEAAASASSASDSKTLALEYKGLAETYKIAAESAMNDARTSEVNALNSENVAKVSETNAKLSETNAKLSETNAKTSETNAAKSESNALISEGNAKTSESNALVSEQKAKTSETNAAKSEVVAKTSETNAKNAQSAAETAENNARQAATQAAEQAASLAAEQAAQNAVNNVTSLMSDYVTASQEAAERAQFIVDGLDVATVDEVKKYLSI